ncbi:TPA: LysR family transcriptional regulator [Mannheimia haemolytica]
MMKRENYNDLYAFLTVANETSFSKAAAKLGVSSPALSKTIRLLEERLGLQLFTRTTRQVTLTQAGQQLFHTAEQSFTKLNQELDLLAHYRESPSGLVRINSGFLPLQNILIPKLAHFKHKYPDIQLELIGANHLVDIISEGFDAGVRVGSYVEDGMIAVKISPPIQTALVASPDYFAAHGFPKKIEDIFQHHSLGYRLSNGEIAKWHFYENEKEIEITPRCQWFFNDPELIKTAALQGLGLAYLPEKMLEKELASGQLIAIFSEYCAIRPPIYLYYPHRNVSPALRAVIDTLKIV